MMRDFILVLKIFFMATCIQIQSTGAVRLSDSVTLFPWLTLHSRDYQIDGMHREIWEQSRIISSKLI
jgi:hypothetical protein